MIPALGKQTPAFTRLELLVCLCALALLTMVIAPALAASGSRADRIACFNNLRQIGNAFIEFGLEHNDLPPWRVSDIEGGNFNRPEKHELWFQYWWIRDSLKTPSMLMDPAEGRANARVATSWNLVPGGLQSHKNNGVAYVLNLDVTTFLPGSLLVADRNIVDNGIGSCSSGINIPARVSRHTRWFNEIHGSVGNVALAGGSVDQLDAEGLRSVIDDTRIVSEAHIMKAQW